MGIFISGANGYVGSHLIKIIKNKDNSIFTPNIEELDLSNFEDLDNYFSNNRITKVIHLAACLDSNDYQNLFLSNIIGLFNLLKVCKKHNIKYFVFVSGNNVYGSKQNYAFKEDDTKNPVVGNNYGITKYFGELMIKDFLKNTQCIYSIIRISDIYGPGQKTGNLIKKIVANLLSNEPQTLYGVGDRTRDYIYIDDVVRGIYYIFSNHLSGEYNLSTGVGTSVKELINIVNGLFDNKLEIRHLPVINEDHTCVVLDNKKLAINGYSPVTSVSQGLLKIVEFERERYDKII